MYLGRSLYSTFMEAYTQVDTVTRRSMEAMLRTWKEPVPGSLDYRPVFPLETVRPIENALIKAKTAVLHNQRQVQPQAPYQSTPTPPQHQGQFHPPPPTPQQSYLQYPGGQHPPPQQPTPTPHFQPYQQFTSVSQPPPALEALKSDIASLISQGKGQLAANIYDQSVQSRLQGLLNLQNYVQAHVLSPDELIQVRASVNQLAASAPTPARSTPQPPVSAPQWQPPASNPPPFHPPQTSAPFVQAPTAQAVPALPLLAPGALSSLQALLANGQKPSTPQMRTAVPALQNASHTQLNSVQSSVAAAPTSNTSELLAALSKSGIFTNPPAVNTLSTPQAPTNASAPPANPAVALLASLQGVLKPVPGLPTLPPTQLGGSNKPKISMTSAALKTFRPELIRSLYDDQPNQCSNCGRRFLATEEGRAKKERHLDWHFRTNQRMADPNTNRGHHRNWYVDEMEWISLTEFDPSTTTVDASNPTAAKVPQKGPQDQAVRAPAGVTRNTCSVCYEDMRSSYSEELQDWVFTNATYYNGKIAHATCVAEIKKSQPMPVGAGGTGAGGSLAAALAGLGAAKGQRERSATPDSTLGKRKAEGVFAGAGARVKLG